MSNIQYRGLPKLIEECGEVLTEAGKLMAYPSTPHPDGRGLVRGRLETEIGDLYGALEYFVVKNNLNRTYISERSKMKYHRFMGWPMAGIIEHDTE